MSEFTAPSGAKVVINLASFEAASALHRAMLREVAPTGEFDMRSILTIGGSEAINAALWPCLVRCLYADEKITPRTFDAAEARGDYYKIVTACLKENLGPLVEGLFSALSELGLATKRPAAGPESK